MGRHPGDHRGGRRGLWWAAAALIVVAAAIAVAISTGALQLGNHRDSGLSAEQSAQQRCQADVMSRLMSARTATLSDLHTEPSSLDVDGRDFSSLNASEQLKGIDASHIAVLNVSGIANTPSEVGTTIADHFDCRAYFVDGALTHTLVVFEHNH